MDQHAICNITPVTFLKLQKLSQGEANCNSTDLSVRCRAYVDAEELANILPNAVFVEQIQSCPTLFEFAIISGCLGSRIWNHR